MFSTNPFDQFSGVSSVTHNECGDTRNVGKFVKWICRKHLVIL